MNQPGPAGPYYYESKYGCEMELLVVRSLDFGRHIRARTSSRLPHILASALAPEPAMELKAS